MCTFCASVVSHESCTAQWWSSEPRLTPSTLNWTPKLHIVRRDSAAIRCDVTRGLPHSLQCASKKRVGSESRRYSVTPHSREAVSRLVSVAVRLRRAAESPMQQCGVVGVQFKVDGVNLGSEDTTERNSLSWDTTLAQRTHVLTAFARDAVGNVGVSAPITVNVIK